MSPKEYNINVTPILCDWRNYMDKINSFYKMLKYNAEKSGGVAGAAGFEPATGGVKVRCLTAWLHPNTEL